MVDVGKPEKRKRIAQRATVSRTLTKYLMDKLGLVSDEAFTNSTKDTAESVEHTVEAFNHS